MHNHVRVLIVDDCQVCGCSMDEEMNFCPKCGLDVNSKDLRQPASAPKLPIQQQKTWKQITAGFLMIITASLALFNGIFSTLILFLMAEGSDFYILSLLLVFVVIMDFLGFAVGLAITYLTFKGFKFHRGIIVFIFAAGCFALVPTIILGVIILLLAMVSTIFINMTFKELKPLEDSQKSPEKAGSKKVGKHKKK